MGRTVKIIAPAAMLVALLTAPATATGAPRCDAPPGTAAVDEQCESIPGADRARGLEDRVGAGRPVTGHTVKRLERSQNGRGVVDRLIDRQVRQAGIQLPSTGGRSAPPLPQIAREPSNDPIAAVGSALGSVGAVSAAALAALLGLLLALTRRRRAARLPT